MAKTRSSKRQAESSAFNWHFFKPWEIEPGAYHDSFVTPGTRKIITPIDMLVAIVSPLLGGRHAKKYPAGTVGTSFSLQVGSTVYMGWVIARGGGQAALHPDKAFAEELVRRLGRTKMWREDHAR